MTRTMFALVLMLALQCIEFCRSENNTLCLTGADPYKLADECSRGYYCPLFNASDSTTAPVQCAATDACIIDRLQTEFCDPQGTYEPIICEEGYYCPTPVEKIECPEGHYCPLGQYQPIECGVMTSCPAGSSEKLEWLSIIVVLIADAGILVLFYFLHTHKRQRSMQSDSKNVIPVSDEQDVEANEAIKDTQKLSLMTQKLCKNLQRARGDHLPLIRIAFSNLSLTIPARGDNPAKTILQGVSGSIEPAKVTAIMGPSGAGKTTFLNTLMGRTDSGWSRGGSLLVNGVSEEFARFRRIVGYVPQEDVMHRDLTVYDNISFAASQRLPADWTEEERVDHIHAVISTLLLDKVQNERVGDEMTRGVSGGQRKRCNVGMELAAAPGLLLLDEPTSGLDSTSAMTVCQLLQDLAHDAQITVAMVIHQPRAEIWNQLDELLLLAPGGLTVYQGPQRLAVTYFQQRFAVKITANENPADALMDCIAHRATEFVEGWSTGGVDLVQQLKQQSRSKVLDTTIDAIVAVDSTTDNIEMNSTRVHETIPPNPLRQVPGFFLQTVRVIARNIWKQLANPSSFGIEVGLAIFAGGIMGSSAEVKYQGILSAPYTLLSPTPLEGLIPSFFFTVGLAISLASASAGVSVFGEEQAIYRREVAVGHSHLAYFLGTNIAQLPRLFLCSLHFAFIFHIQSQPLTPFRTFLAITFLLYTAIYGVAAFVSMLVQRKNAALLAVVLSLLVSSMTGKSSVPEGIQYLSASRWATEAIFTIETRPYLHVMQVREISAENGGYTLNRVPLDLALMFVMSIFYRLAAYLAMCVADRRILTHQN